MLKARRRFVIIGVIAVACIIGLIFAGYWFGWDWTGFGPETTEPKQHAKTLWDWLQLLIIPVVLAVAALLFNLASTRTEQRIALDRQREDLLQKYLDCMSDLLLKEGLRSSAVEAEVRNFARVRTITLLFQLDARRIGLVFGFLREAKLISKKSDESIVSLSRADLRKINLSQANLSGAGLSEVDLSGADLRKADLTEANLNKAYLTEANLIEASLSEAYLIKADLSGAHLDKADLSEANLSEANLSGAYLHYANLSEAKVTEEQLKIAALLKGATMPDGSIHP